MSDIHLIAGFLCFFITIGIALPIINVGFENTYTGSSDVTGLKDDVADNTEENSLSIWRVFKSLFLVFFWSFGELPVLANTIMMIPRIIFTITVARNIWVGGGN